MCKFFRADDKKGAFPLKEGCPNTPKKGEAP
jgi:hypothetical protein